MADVILNNQRGSLIEHHRNGEDLIVVLLKTAQADDTLRDYDDLAALLAAGGGTANVEADFTNYSREVILNANWTITIDDTGNLASADFADITWSPAGNGTNNTLAKLLVCIDGANDAARLPVTAHDFVTTTDGNDLTAVVDSAGFYNSTD
jgi:hypothetical protein